jgi:Flp pilus assembly CpaE family ATPase
VLSEADTVVAVSDSSVVGLARFLRASAELRELFPETPLIAVANRVRSRTAGISPRAQVRQTLERFGGLRDIVLLPHDDRSLDECELRAQSLCDVAPQSGIRHAIQEVTKRCLPMTTESPQSTSREKRESRLTPFVRRRG